MAENPQVHQWRFIQLAQTLKLRSTCLFNIYRLCRHDNFATRTELAMISTSGEGIYKMIIPLPIQPLGSAVLQVTNGNYVSCADITLSEGVPFSINALSCAFQRFGHVV